MNQYTCNKCLNDYEEDDVVWADATGDVDRHIFAYCVECLPAQQEEN